MKRPHARLGATLAVAGGLGLILLQPETAAGAAGLYDAVISTCMVAAVDPVSTVIGCY